MGELILELLELVLELSNLVLHAGGMLGATGHGV